MVRIGLLLLAATTGACGPREVEVVFYDDFSWREQRQIERIATDTASEVRRLLPALPRNLIIRAQMGEHVVPETGETGTAAQPNIVYWTVDPKRNGGVIAIARAHLRASLFHEFNHLVRGAGAGTNHAVVDRVISEGLATVFERDSAGAPVPWGAYPPEVESWVPEILALPPDAPQEAWMFRHPDGRRWIGYKVGTFLVDRAVRRSLRSAADLVSLPTQEILRLALTK